MQTMKGAPHASSMQRSWPIRMNSQVDAVVVGDEVHGQTQVAEPARAADAVQVGLRVLREVEVDDDVHRLNVNATREEVCKGSTSHALRFRYRLSSSSSLRVFTHSTSDVHCPCYALWLFSCDCLLHWQQPHSPDDTRLRQWPLRKSWKTRLRWLCSILA